jgi:hypothetical protein
LAKLLSLFVDAHQLGSVVLPVDLYYGQEDYVSPDISFFTAAQHGELLSEQKIRLAPPLVVEVLSKSSIKWDREDKRGFISALASGSTGSSTPSRKRSTSSISRPGVCRKRPGDIESAPRLQRPLGTGVRRLTPKQLQDAGQRSGRQGPDAAEGFVRPGGGDHRAELGG